MEQHKDEPTFSLTVSRMTAEQAARLWAHIFNSNEARGARITMQRDEADSDA